MTARALLDKSSTGLIMLENLIRQIAPAQIDQQMFRMTEICILVLLALFLIFVLWIPGRIALRYFQILWSRLLTRRTLKKTGDMRDARNTLKTKLFKHILWAKGPFRAFHLSWDEARPQGEEKAILPVRMREYLTPQIVLDGARNRRIAEALPGIFVALGIFGTFLGLVLGLRELEFGKLESLQSGVGHLISGLSLAFLTSLCGIALSVIFSIVYRFSISRLERSFLSLDVLLCQAYPFETHERYARRLNDMQADIKHGLQTLATDVATQISGTIGSHFGEALEHHLVPVMKDLHGWFEAHVENSRKQQDNLIGGFNEHLTHLSKLISEHFQNFQDGQSEAMQTVLEHYSTSLTETLQNQLQSMEQIIVDTTESQKGIKQQLVEFSEQLQRQFQSQGQLIEKTNRAGEILSQSLEGLESIAEKLKSSVVDISSAAELLERSANSAKQGQEILKETMERQIDTMGRTRDELESTWHMLTESAGNLVNQVNQTVHDLTTVVGENLVQALDSFDAKVAEVVERFSGTLFETNQIITEIPSLVAKMNDNINAIKDAISEQKDIVNSIKETSEEVISENLQNVVNASENLNNSTVKIASSTDSMRQFLVGFSETMISKASSFNETNQEIMSEVNRVMNELSIEMHQTQSLLDIKGPLSIALQRFETNSIGSSVDADGKRLVEIFSGPINNLTQRLDELGEALTNQQSKDIGTTDIKLLDKVAGIDRRVEALPKLFETIVSQLDNLNSSASRLTDEFDKMHDQAKGDDAADSRWRRVSRLLSPKLCF